jgi:hypothetical protein
LLLTHGFLIVKEHLIYYKASTNTLIFLMLLLVGREHELLTLLSRVTI